jgi:hypothetical protein
MAWTTPGTATAGEVLTAAFWNTNVRDNSIMGSPVYTNEAARDAAIPAPSEGMQCYLTAPTIPAATGASTFLPSGIRTIYNGSVWVCVTEIGGFTAATGATNSATFTATLTGSPGTNVSVTLVTGTTALISIGGRMVVDAAGNEAGISVAVSGATTLGASTDWGIGNTVTNAIIAGHTTIISGLTAGTNTFTLNYFGGATANATFARRKLVVKGIA